MKRAKTLLIIMTALCINAPYVQAAGETDGIENGGDEANIVYNIGSIGFDSNIYGNDRLNLFTAEFLGIYWQDNATSLGLKFTPFLLASGSDKERMYSKISPLNLDIYWNPIWDIREGGIFGPFASVNYFLSEKNDLAFTAGLYFSFFTKPKSDSSKFVNNIITVKTGYRYINDKNAYYVGVNADILEIILVTILLFTILHKDSTGNYTSSDDYAASDNNKKGNHNKERKHKSDKGRRKEFKKDGNNKEMLQ